MTHLDAMVSEIQLSTMRMRDKVLNLEASNKDLVKQNNKLKGELSTARQGFSIINNEHKELAEILDAKSTQSYSGSGKRGDADIEPLTEAAERLIAEVEELRVKLRQLGDGCKCNMQLLAKIKELEGEVTECRSRAEAKIHELLHEVEGISNVKDYWQQRAIASQKKRSELVNSDLYKLMKALFNGSDNEELTSFIYYNLQCSDCPFKGVNGCDEQGSCMDLIMSILNKGQQCE